MRHLLLILSLTLGLIHGVSRFPFFQTAPSSPAEIIDIYSPYCLNLCTIVLNTNQMLWFAFLQGTLKKTVTMDRACQKYSCSYAPFDVSMCT